MGISPRWIGTCLNCSRQVEIESREVHAQKALCDACPVVDECRQFARTNREYGYWAGESEEDRYVLGYRVSAPIGIRCSMARSTAPRTSTN